MKRIVLVSTGGFEWMPERDGVLKVHRENLNELEMLQMHLKCILNCCK